MTVFISEPQFHHILFRRTIQLHNVPSLSKVPSLITSASPVRCIIEWNKVNLPLRGHIYSREMQQIVFEYICCWLQVNE